jgi:hypothetical protein
MLRNATPVVQTTPLTRYPIGRRVRRPELWKPGTKGLPGEAEALSAGPDSC